MDRPGLGHDMAEPTCDMAETWAMTRPEGLRYGRPVREGLAAGGECHDTKFCIMVERQHWCCDTAQLGLRYNAVTR